MPTRGEDSRLIQGEDHGRGHLLRRASFRRCNDGVTAVEPTESFNSVAGRSDWTN